MKAWPRCELSYIMLKDAYPNPFNANRMNVKDYEGLKRDLMEKGVEGLPPILVTPRGGGYMIVDGEHRWRAALELGLERIKAEIVHLSDDEAKVECFRRNMQRGSIDYLKAADLFKMEKDSGLTVREIAEKYGLSTYTVDSILQLARLPGEVRDFVSKVNESAEAADIGFKFTLRHLIALSKLPPPRTLSFAKAFFEGRCSGPEAEKAVASYLAKSKALSMVEEKSSRGLIHPKAAGLLKNLLERDPLAYSEETVEALCRISDEKGQVEFIKKAFLERLDRSSLYSLSPISGPPPRGRRSTYLRCQCGRTYLVKGKVLDALEMWEKPAEKVIEILPEHVGKKLHINYADMISYFE